MALSSLTREAGVHRKEPRWAFFQWLLGAFWVTAIIHDIMFQRWGWLLADIIPPVGVFRGFWLIISLVFNA